MGYFLRNGLLVFLAVLSIENSCFSQKVNVDIKNYKVSIESPYHLDLKKDLAIGLGATALIITGRLLQANKPQITQEEIDNETTDHIPAFDLPAIHQYQNTYLAASNVLLYTAMAMPFISFVDLRVKGHAPQVIALYFEALAINGAAYSMTTGLISRRRPLTWNTDVNDGIPEVPNDKKLTKSAEDSFFSGHTSTAATTTFFGARIFTDFRPHSKLVPFVWGAAVAVPAFTAFARYKAGKHFPSDVITGYVVGASIGYLVPVLHRVKGGENVSLFPTENGLGMVYTF